MSTQRRYFGTDGVRGRVGSAHVNAPFVLRLGWAFGKVLSRHNKSARGKVLIGKDTRISGYLFESALEAGLSSAGLDVHMLGPMPTPAIAYLTRTLRAQAGIVISASHNPFYDNGIKFFSALGTKLPDDLEFEIEAQLDEPFTTVDSTKLGKAKRIDDAAGRYIEFCKSTIPNSVSLKGLKVVVDCANGATYHIAPSVFTELGAEVTVIHAEPNGLNINEACGSTHPEDLKKKVLELKADLGIALDGDGDRLIMVDHQGNICDGDDVLFIIAAHRKAMASLQGGVVGTVMTNFGFENAMKELSIPFVRTNVGDRYVLQSLAAQAWQLGGETSGHIICLDLNTTGDGIIAALQVLTVMVLEQKSLHDLRSSYHKFPQVMINVATATKGDPLKSEKIVNAIQAAESQLSGQGRVVLRASGTEPVVRVMVEANEESQAAAIAQALAGIVKEAFAA